MHAAFRLCQGQAEVMCWPVLLEHHQRGPRGDTFVDLAHDLRLLHSSSSQLEYHEKSLSHVICSYMQNVLKRAYVCFYGMNGSSENEVSSPPTFSISVLL